MLSLREARACANATCLAQDDKFGSSKIKMNHLIAELRLLGTLFSYHVRECN